MELPEADRHAADQAEEVILSRLGRFPPAAAAGPPSELGWLAALIRTAQQVAALHATLGVDPAITRATLGDVGRHWRLHQQTAGAPGLANWWWLSHVFGGNLFQLGRLQFLLRSLRPAEPAPPPSPDQGASPWCLDVHIPDAGPLTPDSVAHSFAAAAAFFPRHFPGQPAAHAILSSWVLDPYLADHLDPNANLVRFQQLFTRYGRPAEAHDDARYFIFRTRSTDPAALAPTSRLRREFLRREAAGGRWSNYRGVRPVIG